MIILEPEERICKEGFCSRPMTCPYCGGKGWFYGGRGLPETVCPDCEGTKRGHRTGYDRLETECKIK